LAFLPNYSNLPEIVSVSGVINHFLAFFTLYILFSYAYPTLTCKRRITLLIIYAFFIEIVQYFLPTRAAEFMDIVVDSVGIFVAFYLQKRKIVSF
jgi:VanZ family protein